MRKATIAMLATLGLGVAGSALANPDCYYDAPRIRDVVVAHGQLRIRGECLVEPYNPIPKVQLDAREWSDREPLPLLGAAEAEVVVQAPELAGGDYVLHLHRGYHHKRFAFSILAE